MSGYRESSFDPNAGEQVLATPPTWVQRIGIACLFGGAALTFAYLAGKWGLIPQWLDSPMPGALVVIMAGPLIGSRRTPLSPATRRRRLLIVAAATLAFAIAAAVTIYFQGA